MTVCHMPWTLFLEPFAECAHSVRIRTDTTLDQDCVLKATVQVCTARMVVSLMTTYMNFNTPPLAQIAPFDARFASQKRKYHSTKKLRNHVCQMILVCATQAFKPGQLHLGHSRVSKRPPWLVYNHSMVLNKRLLSLCHPLASLGSNWALKVVRQVGRPVSLHEISCRLTLLLCSLLCSLPLLCSLLS